jgi:hypothetical protein
VAAVTASAQPLSRIAVMAPKMTSSDQPLSSACRPRVRSADSHIKPPVSTGYSTAVSRYGTAPMSSRSSLQSGTTSE